MDPLVDWEKASSTQMKIEDVENIRDLNLKAIEAIEEVNADVLEEIFIQPIKLIALTEDSLQHVEHRLKTKIITPICNNETDLERTHLGRVETILEDFKCGKDSSTNATITPFLIIVT
jgi:hypothetical protein